MKPIKPTQSKKQCLSRETLEGLRITGETIIVKNLRFFILLFNETVHSFCELAPKLITGGHYLLSEAFSQDPSERYFSKQRHRGGGNENATVAQFYNNATILTQRQQIRSDLTTMNVEPSVSSSIPTPSALQPLPKRHCK